MPIYKITLIEPKSPGRHVYSMVKMPRLGLPMLGTQLKNQGYQVKYIYGSSTQIKAADIANSDLVGVSTTTSTCPEAYKIARYARQRGIPVVIGGVHASFVPEEAIQYCDYVCCGESDNSFSQLVECLNRGESPSAVPGIYFYQNGELVSNPWPQAPDITSLPEINASMLFNLGLSWYPVMTSRGCPYDCTFCCVNQMFGRRYRYRTMEQVLHELGSYSGKNVFFCDDNFTARPKHSKELFREMIKRGSLPAAWGAQVRADTARDEELVELMSRANCRIIYVGMESFNPRTLEAFNKKQEIEDIEYCIETFHRHGIMIHGMFVLGSDEDDMASVRETMRYTRSLGLDTVQYLSLVPLPGTNLFRELESQGRLLTRDWKLYDGQHVVFKPRLMAAVELQNELFNGYKAFYLPSRWTRGLAGRRKQAMLYRMAGYYLARLYIKESTWYRNFLQNLSEIDKRPSFQLSKTLEAFQLKRFHYLAKEKILDLKIKEQKDAFMVEMSGCLNKMALREVLNTFKSLAGKRYKDMVINIGQLNFDSEEILCSFIRELDKFSGKVRRVKVLTSLGESIMKVVEKDNQSVPNFEF